MMGTYTDAEGGIKTARTPIDESVEQDLHLRRP